MSIGSVENDDEDEYEQVFIESMQNVKDNEDVRDLWWCSDFALDYMLPILFYGYFIWPYFLGIIAHQCVH